MLLPNGQPLLVTDEFGIRHAYDPRYAHDYYLRNRKLKGRKHGTPDAPTGRNRGATKAVELKTKQKKALADRIVSLEKKLSDLNALIKEREMEEKEAQRAAAKPDTAAEKAKKARDAEKYRDKHKQELKTKAKRAAAKAPTTEKPKPKSSAELKELATKVKTKIAEAKAKLRAL